MGNNEKARTITVSGISEAAILEEVAERVEEETYNRISKAIDTAIEKTVRKKLTEVTEDVLRARIEGVIAEGFQKTNSYGEPIGEPISIKTIITTELEKQHSDRWNKAQGSIVQQATRDVIETTFKKEFDKEIETARKALREQIDAIVNGKFAECLKSAMGVK